MGNPINHPNTLQFAAAASYARGQEVNRALSKEKDEEGRALRDLLFGAKAIKRQQQTNDAEKGFLA